MVTKKIFEEFKKMLDKPGRVWYISIRKGKENRQNQKGRSAMYKEYWEAHEAEWLEMQEYLQNPEN